MVIPGKHPNTRIKALALTNGHDRYMATTPERALVSVGCDLIFDPFDDNCFRRSWDKTR